MIDRVLKASKAKRCATLATFLVLAVLTGCVPPDPEAGEGAIHSLSPTPGAVSKAGPSATLSLETMATDTPSPTHTPTTSVTPAPTPAPLPTVTPSPRPANQVSASPTPCVLPVVVVPTIPVEIPGYTQLDRSTGLHMTGTPQQIDPAIYHLKVTGKVKNPLSLGYDDLRCMPKVEVHCKLVCPETFVDEATWAGVPLDYVLELAGMQGGAEGIKLTSADGYSVSISMLELDSKDNLLAYEWEGEPLPILHGFPVRAVFPELVGGRWVKWLVEIEVY